MSGSELQRQTLTVGSKSSQSKFRTEDIEAQLATIYSHSAIGKRDHETTNGAGSGRQITHEYPHAIGVVEEDENSEVARLQEEVKKKNVLLVRARGTIEELQVSHLMVLL